MRGGKNGIGKNIDCVEEPTRRTNLTNTLYFTIFYLLYMFRTTRPSSGAPSSKLSRSTIGTFVQAVAT